MKKRNNLSKLGFIFVILILALAGISISYAGLSDTITIFGNVTTADNFVSLFGTDKVAWTRMSDHPKDFTYEFNTPSWSNTENWETYLRCLLKEEVIYTHYIFADKHYRVGKLSIIRDNQYLNFTYQLDEGFVIEKTYLHIAAKLEQIPQKGGIPIPEQFEYIHKHMPYTNEFSFQVVWDQSWNDTPLYIAASVITWGEDYQIQKPGELQQELSVETTE
jgi:hypothetical protein